MHGTDLLSYLFREMPVAVVLTRSLLNGNLISNLERKLLSVNTAAGFLLMMKLLKRDIYKRA
jgi:hypothetical protein